MFPDRRNGPRPRAISRNERTRRLSLILRVERSHFTRPRVAGYGQSATATIVTVIAFTQSASCTSWGGSVHVYDEKEAFVESINGSGFNFARDRSSIRTCWLGFDE
jgi:hypothetical protein